MKPRAYVALLRGINVGGHKPVKMDALRKAFASLGFGDIKTLLASGNVLFSSELADEARLTQQIKETLKTKFGLDIGVVLRSIEDMEKIVSVNPFAGVKVTPETRLYVTFLSAKPGSKLKLPAQASVKTYRILKISGREIFTLLTLSAQTQSTDLMTFIEKNFGKEVTTRNWNTVLMITGAT